MMKQKDDAPQGTELEVAAQSPFAIVNRPWDDVRELIEANIGAGQLNSFDLDRIRVPDGETDFFSVPTLDGTEPKKTFDAVVLFVRDARGFWPVKKVSGSPPSCRSDDGIYGYGVRTAGAHYPDDNADEPHECSGCSHAQWGSDPEGGAGQWCKQTKALFILFEDTFLPSLFVAPPTSIQAVKKFILRLAGYGRHYSSVITRFELEKERNADGQQFNKLRMSVARPATDAEAKRFLSISRDIKAAMSRSPVPAIHDDIEE